MEPEDQDQDSGNVDLKQLGLTLKPAGPGDKEGVVIADVDPNSDAAQKGIKEGDVILKAGDETVSSPQDVVKALKKTQDDGLAGGHVPHQEERRPDGPGGDPAQQELMADLTGVQ